jgi:hypothetical protein
MFARFAGQARGHRLPAWVEVNRRARETCHVAKAERSKGTISDWPQSQSRRFENI